MAKTAEQIIAYLLKNKANICEVLNEKDLKQYVEIQSSIKKSLDDAFQKLFTNFYVLRFMPIKDRGPFYKYFEEIRGGGVPYEKILTSIQEITGKLHASFSSKMAHTIDKNLPIIDSHVLSFVNLSLPPKDKNDEGNKIRIQKTVDLYKELQALFAECLAHPVWKEKISPCFDDEIESDKFKYDKSSFSEMKKLDTLIWKTGSKDYKCKCYS